MTPLEIAHHRLHNQRISNSAFTQPEEVVAWMGPVQGQDYPGAKWSIGLRVPQATDADVERAIEARTIVRTWPMRGTLHMVAPDDVRWILALTAPRVIAASARRYRELELDEPTLVKSCDVLVRALGGGQQLTRTELAAALEEAGISPEGQRLSHILIRAAMERLICFGVRRGKQFTYTLLDEWIPPAKPKERGEALAELARRYFTSRGPATLKDFVWWCGLTTAHAREGLESIKAELAEVRSDGQTYWMPQTIPAPARDAPAVDLLPGFDEYVLGYTDRSAVLDTRYTRLIGKNGMFAATIVIDGRVEGTWKRTFKGKGFAIEAAPFDTLDANEQRAFTAAVDRFAAFLEMPVV